MGLDRGDYIVAGAGRRSYALQISLAGNLRGFAARCALQGGQSVGGRHLESCGFRTLTESTWPGSASRAQIFSTTKNTARNIVIM